MNANAILQEPSAGVRAGYTSLTGNESGALVHRERCSNETDS